MQPTEDLQGQTLGSYQVQEMLGQGAMSQVYHARQTNLRRDVALKVLSATLSAQPEYAANFEREIAKVAQLEHVYIVPLYDFGLVDQISFIVMRLMTGGTLADRMQQPDHSPRLPSLREADGLLRLLAGALDYVHSQGIVHSDLKPQNIMFDEHHNPYLVDFGIARLARTMPAMTGSGVILGTPAYMAPEQWRGEALTGAADQYVLGVILYQMITGVLPFDADSPFALMHQHMTQAPIPPHERRSGIPEAVSTVLLQALAKNPQDRFPNVTQFSRAFERALRDTHVDDEPTNFFERPQETAPILRHIFLSYSRADSELMGRVRDELSGGGFKVWTDGNLTPGTPSWKDGIEQAIEGASCMVVILSPEAKQSEWVKRELDYALACDLPIFPLLARGDERSAVPFALISAQRADIRDNYATGVQNLMAAIRQHMK
jgi:serine/threonine-protein kinase